MDNKYTKYKIEDFLNDSEFCYWAKTKDPKLESYFNNLLKENPELKETFHKAYILIELLDVKKEETSVSHKLESWNNIKATHQKRKKKIVLKQASLYAASIAMLFAIGVSSFDYLKRNNHSDLFTYNITDFKETNLVLDDGTTLKIASEQTTVKYNETGKKININNKVISNKTNVGKIKKNQIIVPFGKQTKIILSDNTEVWLNAGSRLIYPSKFDQNSRNVVLQGEGFFKVTKDKSRPFIVETANSSIKVLGTSFNVKAYPDEEQEETVLVEGSIKLNPGKQLFGKNIMVKPNQKVLISNNNKDFKVEQVDVKPYYSWIDGLIIIRNEPLPEVLKQISRYYNLNITWDKTTENKIISGKLDLKDDYNRVLKALELISNCKANYENETVNFKQN